ncbi:MAG: polysaccharide biosynthesis tyrosine autokinase, partial [Lysobacterales bacterium]
ITLESALHILRTRLPIILGAVALVLAFAALNLYRTTPLYTARALVMIDSGRNQVFENATSISGGGGGYSYYDSSLIENQVQILYSRSLAERVVKNLGLDQGTITGVVAEVEEPQGGLAEIVSLVDPRKWFVQEQVSSLTEAEKATQQRESLINSVLGGLTASTLGFSTAIEIRYVDADPERAARLANALSEAYVSDQLEAKFEASERATRWLTDRVQQLADQVRDADVAVQQYKSDNNLTEVSGTSVVDQQLAGLSQQLILARSELAEQEARYARVAELQSAGRGQDVSQVVASPLINSLRAQETELLRREADFSSRYGPRHPRMVDLQSEKENLLANIEIEVQRVIETIRNDLAVTRARVQSLESSLRQASGQTSEDSRARIRLRELEANAASSHAMYDAFLSRFKEVQGQEGVQVSDSRIISPAVIPTSPSSPNVNRTLTVAGGFGLLLGFALAFLMERLDSGFRTATQIEKMIGLPVLASVPELSRGLKSSGSASEQVVTKPMSAFSEAIRGLQMGINLSNVDHPPEVFLVTSSVASEGKTTVAISLARMAASGGKRVLLIDCDLRRPAVAKELGVSKFDSGLVEVLLGSSKLEDCLKKDPQSSVEFLPVRFKTGNPVDILGSVAMERLITEARKNYDLVIIDSAPLLPVNDTRVLARLVDAALFAVRWEKTPRDAVRNAARVLAEAHAAMPGIVLTRADSKRFHSYSYGQYGYQAYNKYYAS